MTAGKEPINVIVGAEKGNFEVRFFDGRSNQVVKHRFAAEAIDRLKKYYDELKEEFNVVGLYFSSTVHFHDENNITSNQVSALKAALDIEE